MPEITPATEEDAAEFWQSDPCQCGCDRDNPPKPAPIPTFPGAVDEEALSEVLGIPRSQFVAKSTHVGFTNNTGIVEVSFQMATAPEPEPEPLAEPTYPGAVVVDRPGLPWVRTLGGMWSWGDQGTTWENIEHPRLPTPAEKAAWGIPDVLPDGHVAINPDEFLSPHLLRATADGLAGDNWRVIAEDVLSLADALEAREASDA